MWSFSNFKKNSIERTTPQKNFEKKTIDGKEPESLSNLNKTALKKQLRKTI